MVGFDDEIQSGFGSPLIHIPKYLAELEGLTIPDHRGGYSGIGCNFSERD